MDKEIDRDEPDLHRARMELFFGLDATRDIIRRSRILLQYSQAERPANDNERDVTDKGRF